MRNQWIPIRDTSKIPEDPPRSDELPHVDREEGLDSDAQENNEDDYGD